MASGLIFIASSIAFPREYHDGVSGDAAGCQKEARVERKKRASRSVAPKDHEGTSALFYGAVKYDLGFN